MAGAQPPVPDAATPAPRPAVVTALQAAYGAPSQSGFGSAAFHQALAPDAGLEQAALAAYRHFVGDAWQRWGEAAWRAPWREVHHRDPGAPADIVAELRGISDPEAARSAPMILEAIEGAEAAVAALAAAFDDPAVTELRVFNLGDGGAMSGIEVAARRTDATAVLLVFLMD